MTRAESFQFNVAEKPNLGRWLWFALLISLLLHAGLFVFLNLQRLENFGDGGTARLTPPVATPRRFVLADVPEDRGTVNVAEKKATVKPISIPETLVKAPDQVILKPDAGVIAALPLDKPQVADLKSFGEIERSQPGPSEPLANELQAVADSLLEQSALSPSQPMIRAGREEGGASDPAGIPGRLSLGDALKDVGGPISNKPIAVRGGALFEWGKAELRPEAITELQKLGALIQRYPKATFAISGHTDHTGTRETNLLLSQQRADAVRDWLVFHLGIDPVRIRTIGKADDEALPNLGPEKSIEEQAPNRRVEIVIRTRGGE